MHAELAISDLKSKARDKSYQTKQKQIEKRYTLKLTLVTKLQAPKESEFCPHRLLVLNRIQTAQPMHSERAWELLHHSLTGHFNIKVLMRLKPQHSLFGADSTAIRIWIEDLATSIA